MSTELERARAALERRQHTVQAALLADFQAEPGLPGWHLADVYRRLFIGMDLDATEIIEHAAHEAAGAAEHVQAATATGEPVAFDVLARALYLDGFSDAAMLFTLRTESNTRDAGELYGVPFIELAQLIDWINLHDQGAGTLLERLERIARDAPWPTE